MSIVRNLDLRWSIYKGAADRPPWLKLPGSWTRPFDKAAGAVDVLFCKSVGAVGLYHFYTHFSSCFPAPQQAFEREMGQKRRLVAASSYVFEKGRNFSKQVGR